MVLSPKYPPPVPRQPIILFPYSRRFPMPNEINIIKTELNDIKALFCNDV